MTLAEFSIWPMDKGESVGAYVARAVEVVEKSGLSYKVGPMGTCIEGEWDQVMRVIGDCYRALELDCNRIACTVKIDYRKGKSGMIQGKVKSIEEKLGRQV